MYSSSSGGELGIFLALLSLVLSLAFIVTWFLLCGRVRDMLELSRQTAKLLKDVSKSNKQMTILMREIRNHVKGMPDDYGFLPEQIEHAQKYWKQYNSGINQTVSEHSPSEPNLDAYGNPVDPNRKPQDTGML